jgi:hypothetical protein
MHREGVPRLGGPRRRGHAPAVATRNDQQYGAARGQAASCDPQAETAASKWNLKKRDHGNGRPNVSRGMSDE